MKKLIGISICLASTLVIAGGARQAWGRSPQGRDTMDDGVPSREPARALLKMDMKFEPSQRGFYAGQTVPVTIRAYFLGGTGVTVNGRPRLTSDALLLSELSAEPRQVSVQMHGLPYTALLWEGKLTAVKAGPAKTGLELPVALTYREAPRLRPLPSRGEPHRAGAPGGDEGDGQAGADDDPFASLLQHTPFANDPFFAQMLHGHDPLGGMFDDLGGAVRQREVTLRDAGVTLDVAEPPAPRPAGFTGAVGTFELSAALPDETFRVGEPTHLQVTVRGQGSFARLAVDGLPATDQLNTYGVTSEFTSGPTALGGEKIFTQTIMPRRAGELTIPALTLTYFDPRARRYVTRRTTPFRISVAPAGAGAEATSGAAAPTTGPVGDGPATTVPAETALPAAPRATLTPLFETAPFWALVGAMALATLALSLLGRAHQRGLLGRLRAERRVRREIVLQRRKIGAAVARGDAIALFGAGRKALQARLGARWGVPAEAIAAADVVSRLGPRGVRIHDVFERADRVAYAGTIGAPTEPSADRSAPSDLNGWQSLILDELRTLEARA